MSEKHNEIIGRQARTVLATGLSGLQFEAALEQHFENWHRHRYLTLNRVYLLIGALAMAVLTASDKIITPSIIDRIIEIRIPVILFILLVFALSHLKFTVSRMPGFMCLAACALHGSMLLTTYYAAEAGYFHYQGGAIVVIVFVCLMLKIQFQYVLPLAILLWFTHVLCMYFFMIQSFAKFIEIFVLYTVITIISLVVCFRYEIEVRRFFILQTLLKTKAILSPGGARTQLEPATDKSTKGNQSEAISTEVNSDNALNNRSANAEENRRERVVRPMFQNSDNSANTQANDGDLNKLTGKTEIQDLPS